MKHANVFDIPTFKVEGTVSDIKFAVSVRDYINYDCAMEIAQESYDEWLELEECEDTAEDYVYKALENKGIKANVYTLVLGN